MSDLPVTIIFFLTNELNRSIYSPIKDDVIFDLDLRIKNVILRAQIIILTNKNLNLFPLLFDEGKTNRRVLCVSVFCF